MSVKDSERFMRELPALFDFNAEASEVDIQPGPGVVFLRMQRERRGRVLRRMFVELTVGEALVLRRELDEKIGIAAAASEP